MEFFKDVAMALAAVIFLICGCSVVVWTATGIKNQKQTRFLLILLMTLEIITFRFILAVRSLSTQLEDSAIALLGIVIMVLLCDKLEGQLSTIHSEPAE